MKVQNIGSQNFEAKKFRVPLKKVDLTHPDFLKYGRSEISVNYVKEYENPNAEKIYKEAMKIKDPFERGKKLAEMGHYKLIDMSFKERVKRFFDKIIMDLLW